MIVVNQELDILEAIVDQARYQQCADALHVGEPGRSLPQGPTTRYVVLPTYVHDPWRMNRPHHSMNYYGRATELHYARERDLADGLAD